MRFLQNPSCQLKVVILSVPLSRQTTELHSAGSKRTREKQTKKPPKKQTTNSVQTDQHLTLKSSFKARSSWEISSHRPSLTLLDVCCASTTTLATSTLWSACPMPVITMLSFSPPSRAPSVCPSATWNTCSHRSSTVCATVLPAEMTFSLACLVVRPVWNLLWTLLIVAVEAVVVVMVGGRMINIKRW